MCMFCSEYTYCVHTYISCGPECACVYVYVSVCSVYIRKCLYICTHVQPLLEEVGVGVVVHAPPFALLSMQYKTEADKKGFCFICHIAAYEFDRRADVSGLCSRIHTCTYIQHAAIFCCFNMCSNTCVSLIDLPSLCSCSNLQPM